jgi:hypothetical protein
MANQSTTATNIQSTNVSQNTNQDSQKYFNNFYSPEYVLGADQNDVLNAYFEQYTGDVTSGRNLASAITYTAKAQNIDPMSILDEFRKMGRGQLNNYLAAFLNVNRVPTSQIGINSGTTTNRYVQRTILP